METVIADVMRYLGYHKTEPDEQVAAMAKELIAVFASSAAPKNVYGIWDCTVEPRSVKIGSMIINSENLAGHLKGCSRAVLLAATLGQEADTLIRRYSLQAMEKAVIAQAVCTVMIENYCDGIEKEIAQKQDLGGLYSVKRFSPGYGDFDIAWQKDIVNLLSCDKRIGLTLTSGCMLVPSKSITAVIGYSGEKKQPGGKCGASGHGTGGRCGNCAEIECGYRENE